MMDKATRATGAEWGRLGQFRQRLLRMDYSLEAMERKARAALVKNQIALRPAKRPITITVERISIAICNPVPDYSSSAQEERNGRGRY